MAKVGRTEERNVQMVLDNLYLNREQLEDRFTQAFGLGKEPSDLTLVGGVGGTGKSTTLKRPELQRSGEVIPWVHYVQVSDTVISANRENAVDWSSLISSVAYEVERSPRIGWRDVFSLPLVKSVPLLFSRRLLTYRFLEATRQEGSKPLTALIASSFARYTGLVQLGGTAAATYALKWFSELSISQFAFTLLAALSILFCALYILAPLYHVRKAAKLVGFKLTAPLDGGQSRDTEAINPDLRLMLLKSIVVDLALSHGSTRTETPVQHTIAIDFDAITDRAIADTALRDLIMDLQSFLLELQDARREKRLNRIPRIVFASKLWPSLEPGLSEVPTIEVPFLSARETQALYSLLGEAVVSDERLSSAAKARSLDFLKRVANREGRNHDQGVYAVNPMVALEAKRFFQAVVLGHDVDEARRRSAEEGRLRLIGIRSSPPKAEQIHDVEFVKFMALVPRLEQQTYDRIVNGRTNFAAFDDMVKRLPHALESVGPQLPSRYAEIRLRSDIRAAFLKDDYAQSGNALLADPAERVLEFAALTDAVKESDRRAGILSLLAASRLIIAGVAWEKSVTSLLVATRSMLKFCIFFEHDEFTSEITREFHEISVDQLSTVLANFGEGNDVANRSTESAILRDMSFASVVLTEAYASKAPRVARETLAARAEYKSYQTEFDFQAKCKSLESAVLGLGRRIDASYPVQVLIDAVVFSEALRDRVETDPDFDAEQLERRWSLIRERLFETGIKVAPLFAVRRSPAAEEYMVAEGQGDLSVQALPDQVTEKQLDKLAQWLGSLSTLKFVDHKDTVRHLITVAALVEETESTSIIHLKQADEWIGRFEKVLLATSKHGRPSEQITIFDAVTELVRAGRVPVALAQDSPFFSFLADQKQHPTEPARRLSLELKARMIIGGLSHISASQGLEIFEGLDVYVKEGDRTKFNYPTVELRHKFITAVVEQILREITNDASVPCTVNEFGVLAGTLVRSAKATQNAESCQKTALLVSRLSTEIVKIGGFAFVMAGYERSKEAFSLALSHANNEIDLLQTIAEDVDSFERQLRVSPQKRFGVRQQFKKIKRSYQPVPSDWERRDIIIATLWERSDERPRRRALKLALFAIASQLRQSSDAVKRRLIERYALMVLQSFVDGGISKIKGQVQLTPQEIRALEQMKSDICEGKNFFSSLFYFLSVAMNTRTTRGDLLLDVGTLTFAKAAAIDAGGITYDVAGFDDPVYAMIGDKEQGNLSKANMRDFLLVSWAQKNTEEKIAYEKYSFPVAVRSQCLDGENLAITSRGLQYVRTVLSLIFPTEENTGRTPEVIASRYLPGSDKTVEVRGGDIFLGASNTWLAWRLRQEEMSWFLSDGGWLQRDLQAAIGLRRITFFPKSNDRTAAGIQREIKHFVNNSYRRLKVDMLGNLVLVANLEIEDPRKRRTFESMFVRVFNRRYDEIALN